MYIDSLMACPTWRNPERASRYDLLVAKGNVEPRVLEGKTSTNVTCQISGCVNM